MSKKGTKYKSEKKTTVVMLSLLSLLFLSIGCKDHSKASSIETKEILPIISHPSWISKEYVTGHFDPAKHDNFEMIDRQYADREGLLLRKDSYAAFREMYDAAQKAGHTLIIKSATRNFEYQKGIWERKWTGKTLLEGGVNGAEIENPTARAKKILLYSSMPGTSRHHWGTDIDLNSFNNDYFKNGKGKDLYQWMLANAGSFGFCQPYTAKVDGRTGYEEECWHWSYMPISKPLTEYSRAYLKNEMIKGFLGSEAALEVDMVNNYVLGINSNCFK